MDISKNVNLLEYKLHKVNELKYANHNGDTKVYPVVLVTCRSPLIYVEVDSMSNRSSTKNPLGL
jgi:hypothetical protein